MNLAVMTSTATVEKLIQTNLMGTIYCCQQFYTPHVEEKRGAFINFSLAVALALKGESVYAASKAGVGAFVPFAREMADFNVRVNMYCSRMDSNRLVARHFRHADRKITGQQVIPKSFQASDV